MKCNHDDCFSCPHPDCILDDKDVVVDPVKLAEKKRKRKEYDRKYYEMHKAEMAEKAHKRYLMKKAGKYIL
jgi:hypothetical protein